MIQNFYRFGQFVGWASGLIRMDAMRSPKGGVVVQGEFYPGGQFIPTAVLEKATEQEIHSILNPSTAPKTAPVPEFSAAKAAKQLASRRKFSLGAHRIQILYDDRLAQQNYFIRYTDPSGNKTIHERRFKRPENAAAEAARFMGTIADKLPKSAPATRETKPKKKDFRYKSTDFFSRGKKAKFQDNLEALRTLKTLELEKRDPTEEEREAISKFVGWGQFPEAFVNEYWKRKDWEKEYDELKSLVGQEGIDSAKASTTNSHFTHPDVIKAHWTMAEKLGFKGGRYLEPAVGAGFYLGFMPENLASKTKTTAVEMESLTADIASKLYPNADVNNSPFQDYPTPNNFFDLVATNVPFDGKVRIHDPKYKGRALLHDYYFMRSVDTAKPGGLIMNITSAGTMDKLDPKVRNYINQHCELVSVIRFPGDAHKDNAGTEVVTDMIMLRKKHPAIPPTTDETPNDAEPKKPGFTGMTRDSLGRLYHWRDGVRVPAPKWDDVAYLPDPDGGDPIQVNRYFAENPEQMLGRLDRSGTMYAGNMKNLVKTDDYEARLAEAIDRLPQDINWADKPVDSKEIPDDRILTAEKLNEGQILLKDGKLYQYENGAMAPLEADEKASAMVQIKEQARLLLSHSRGGHPDEAAERAKLNELYDDFKSKYGLLNSRENKAVLKDDPDLQFLLALENKGEKAAIFEKNTIAKVARAEKADSLADALGISLNEGNRIDVDRMAELLGKSADEIQAGLAKDGLAFQVPGGEFIAASLYLSGKTRTKLKEAQAAAKLDPKYQANVDALLKHQPPAIPWDEIGIKLGSPWVPPETVSQFAADTLGVRPDLIHVKFNQESQTWLVDVDKGATWSEGYEKIWGIPGHVNFKEILSAAVNGKTIKITDKDSDGKVYPLVEETDAANEKVAELRERFKEWVWTDETRKEQLEKAYNETLNDWVPTQYDGSHQTFPGLRTTGWPLRDLQKDAVWRMVSTGKGLLAHEVGLGKTASMVAGAMELKRLGLAKKPTIACLKANISQITAEAQELYPDARILSTADLFEAGNRQRALNMIATGDYDLIVMTHEHMNKMKMKPETIQRFMQDEMEELEESILAIQAEDASKTGKKLNARIVKQLESRKQKLEQDLKKSLAEYTKDDIYFEDTGIDQIFVDEAHYFKSLPCTTKKGNIKGIPTTRSDRATAMFARCRWLMEKNNGRGVVFATGTPIANTMAELYNMQRYLQYDELKSKGLHRFDAWADTYGEITSRIEFKIDGEMKDTSRFNEFINLPELQHLTSDFMDIQRAVSPSGEVRVKRPAKEERVTVCKSNSEMDDFMRSIADRARAIKGKRVEKGDDNMLTIGNDARKGSIDLRLVDSMASDTPTSKANRCVQNVKELYDAHPGTTQCIFTDLGVHDDAKTGFNLTKDMTQKLIELGIPRNQIAHFSESMSDEKKDELQARMRAGEIRVAFGSTKKLGTGTNIQKKLKAVHHLDIPYVPAYIEQRDGRAWRHGNDNKEIEIHKYVQEGSADNLWWQIVASKANFINQYMRGNNARSMTELDTEELSPEQMIAVATGDQDVLKKIDSMQEHKRLKRALNRHDSEQARMKTMIEKAPEKRKILQNARDTINSDLETIQGDFELEVDGNVHFSRPEASEAIANRVRAIKSQLERTDTYRRYSVPKNVARYGKFDIELGDDGMLEISSPSGQTYKSAGTLRSIETVLRNLKSDAEKYDELIRQSDADLTTMTEELKKPFRYRERLDELDREFGDKK